jgi:hypothetical protein
MVQYHILFATTAVFLVSAFFSTGGCGGGEGALLMAGFFFLDFFAVEVAVVAVLLV